MPDLESVGGPIGILVSVCILVFSLIVVHGFFSRPRGDDVIPRSVRWGIGEPIFLLFLYFTLMMLSGAAGVAVQHAVLEPIREWHAEALSGLWWGRIMADPEPSAIAVQLGLPVVAVVTLTLVLLVIVRRDGAPPASLGLRSPPGGFELVRLLALGMALWMPVSFLGIAWRAALETVGLDVPLQAEVLEFSGAVSRGELLFVITFLLLAIVYAPVMEEVLFRSVLYGALRRGQGRRFSALSTSLIFAAIHGNLGAVLPIFVLSLALCEVYERRGCIFDAVIVHAVFNGGTLFVILGELVRPE